MRGLPCAILVSSALLAVAPPAGAYPREIRIAYIQRLDWDSDYPQCMECFVAHSAVPTDWTVTHEAVDLGLLAAGEQSISDFDLGIVTGHLYYELLPDERTVLEEFVDNGGVLWFDDCGSVEVDNLPFGLEINFGGGEYGAWGICYGDNFTVPDPTHPLVRSVYPITASMMRTDGSVSAGQWFTPFYELDPGYTVVVNGRSVGGVHLLSGPAVVAARHGRGAIVATAMDVSCALECVSYGLGETPLSDYYLVINMIGWHDEDADTIWDFDEGVGPAGDADTDGDTFPDALDFDTDGDTIPDTNEAGDADLDSPPVDTDGDTIPDFRDLDSDGDGILDHTEQWADSDGDGFPNPDPDGDGIPSRVDLDSDGDTVPDESEGEGDADGDGIPGFVDADDTDGPAGDHDGDGILNRDDNCFDVFNPEQEDADRDGLGDACDDTPFPSDGGDDVADSSAEADAEASAEAEADAPDDTPVVVDGAGDSGACDPAACVLACRAAGYDTGSCSGDSCVCSGGGPDGGPDSGPPAADGGPSGCGCTVAAKPSPLALLAVFVALGSLVARRRRRQEAHVKPPPPPRVFIRVGCSSRFPVGVGVGVGVGAGHLHIRESISTTRTRRWRASSSNSDSAKSAHADAHADAHARRQGFAPIRVHLCSSVVSFLLPALLLLCLPLSIGCGGGGGTSLQACTNQDDCPPGWLCIDGACRAPDAGGESSGDAAADADPDGDADESSGDAGADADAGDADGSCPAGSTECGSACCVDGSTRCREGACIVDLGACTTDDDCWSDSWCEAGFCVPYGVPADHLHNDDCTRPIDIEAIVPDVQCRWTGPPDGDAMPDWVHVMSTPVVVDFDFDDDPATLAPSIVFTTFPTSGSYRNPGVLRVISGADCAQQWSFPAAEDATMAPASVALGDLDVDGRAEIVAAAHGGGLIAFRYDETTSTLARWWRSGTCDASGGRTPDPTGGPDQWGGPSIHDLDDDGLPEIIYGATVYGMDGCIRSSTFGYPAYHRGVVPVVADVDEDGAMELVLGNALYTWDAASGDLVAESYFAPGSLAAGQVAVADFGVFPLASFADGDRAEVAVISAGQARVQTIEGTVVFGPFPLPGGGSGGLPTIADFDGDGRREFASAGGANYVVFDLDCTASGAVGTCASGRSDGILWTQPSQDLSSNVTGSSVFDFDANGSAEAVYADECFLRIYDGSDGSVVFSAARSSGTTYENPVIVDVDGDFHAEIVSAVNDYAGTLGCPAADPLFPAAAFAVNHGIVVLRDVLDRWAASRPVWSQHAYAVTHVGNRGEIPAPSVVAVNWRTPDLNNFRQNVQGELDALGVPDLTSSGDTGPVRLPCVDGVGTLAARVCNRGLLPVGAGTVVAFRNGSPDGPELCRVTVVATIDVTACALVSCDAALGGEPLDVYVVADPDAGADECLEANNVGLLDDVQCETIG